MQERAARVVKPGSPGFFAWPLSAMCDLALVRAAARCLVLGILATIAQPAAAEPFVPRDDAQVVETLPAGGGDRGLRAARAMLARDPGDVRLAMSVARRHIDRARATGDPRYLGQAQAALAPFWDGDDPGVLLLRATILQSRHEFDAALADLDRLLRRAPDDAQAWLTRATIEQVQGRYAQALASCARVAELAPGLAGQACGDEVRSLSGDAPAAYQALRERLASGPDTAGASAGTLGWAEVMLAEMAERLGRADDAERHYLAALTAAPDPYARAAYADFLLDANRPRDALAALGASAPSRPATADDLLRLPDGLLLRAALALGALHDPQAATVAAALRDRFDAARLRGETSHGREEARFALAIEGDAPRAADLAAANWRNQREPADARIALEAAAAAGRKDLAEQVGRFVREAGLHDARLARLLPGVPAPRS